MQSVDFFRQVFSRIYTACEEIWLQISIIVYCRMGRIDFDRQFYVKRILEALKNSGKVDAFIHTFPMYFRHAGEGIQLCFLRKKK